VNGPREPESERGPQESEAGAAEAVDHFWNAAHELLRALRAVVDAADEFVEEQRQHRTADQDRVRRIDIE
jgi:hypothetical protein